MPSSRLSARPRQSGAQRSRLNAACLWSRRERSGVLLCPGWGPSSRPSPPGGAGSTLGCVSPSRGVGTRKRLGVLGGGVWGNGARQEKPFPFPDISFPSRQRHEPGSHQRSDSKIVVASGYNSYPVYGELFPSFDVAFLPLLCRVTNFSVRSLPSWALTCVLTISYSCSSAPFRTKQWRLLTCLYWYIIKLQNVETRHV